MKKASLDIRSFFKRKSSPTNQNVETTNTISEGFSSSLTVNPLQPEQPSTSSVISTELLHQPINRQETNLRKQTIPTDLGTLQSNASQPILNTYPLTSFGQQKRGFSEKYFTLYPWLEYSIQRDAVYCYFCRLFGETMTYEQIFTRDGFQNWKKLGEKLRKHLKSQYHINNSNKYSLFLQSRKDGTVVDKMAASYDEIIKKNRDYFKIISDIILTLSRQGIPFRGHDESDGSSNKGNYKEICELISRHNETFFQSYNKYFNLSSSDIQNEIVNCAGNIIQSKIVREIKDCGAYAILVDEARCFKEQQLSFCVRYTKKLEIEERFLGFVECSQQRDASSLSNLILNFVDKLGLRNIPIIAQAYDGASVMSGKKGGLQAKFKEKYPEAIYIHCMAHRLNLAVVDTCSDIQGVKQFFNILESLFVHFSQPSNHTAFKHVQKELGMKALELSRISDTRWSCRSNNCQAVKNNYSSIIVALKNEIELNSNRNVVEAIGLLSSITTSTFLVNLVLLTEILTIVNILSKQLQGKENTLGASINIINGTIKTLDKKRNEETSFSELWQDIKKIARENEVNIDTGRSSKRKKTMSGNLSEYAIMSTIGRDENDDASTSSGTTLNEIRNFWLINAYYRMHDSIINHMKIRFSESSQRLAISTDKFLEMDSVGSQFFIEHYREVFNIEKYLLKAEMLVIKSCLQDKVGDTDKFSSLKSIITKDTFPNTYRLLQVALALPIGSTTCERSFSTMRRIKTWLRSRMTQDRFSSLSLLNINNDMAQNIEHHEILKEFLDSGNRKLKLQ